MFPGLKKSGEALKVTAVFHILTQYSISLIGRH